MGWTLLAATLALIAVLAVLAGFLYARRARPEAAAPADRRTARPSGGEPPRYVDENVLFTVYRPPVITPLRWYTLLALAHLAEKRPDAPESAPAPLEEVRRLAARYYGTQAAEQRVTSAESRCAIPEKELLSFVPVVEGVTFNPESKEVRWVKDVHALDFELATTPEHVGKVLRGMLTVYAGGVILADVQLSFEVRGFDDADAARAAEAVESARPYDKIFPSYSHKDTPVVEQFEAYVESLGHRYLRDVRELRSGENFDERLREKIREAEVFQLFWSWNSMASDYVRKEWSYALSLGRPNFVRPTYWEVPRPANAELPPAELAKLHFHQFKPPAPLPPPPVTASEPPPRGQSHDDIRSDGRVMKYSALASAFLFGCIALSAAYLWDGASSIGNSNMGGIVGPDLPATPTPRLSRPRLGQVALGGGTFLMGRDDVPPLKRGQAERLDRRLFWLYAQWPAHPVVVGRFYIDITEVTNAEYAAFVKSTGYPAPPGITGDGRPRDDLERLPVVDVSFEDALAFAAWRSKRDGVKYRLPTEAEWEFAARGGDSRLYPWGEEWVKGRANVGTESLRPVGSFPEGRTPHGVDDMIGNVWEWTSSEAAMYPGNDVIRLTPEERGGVVVRGGSYLDRLGPEPPITATTRGFLPKTFRHRAFGFRLVSDP